MGPGVDVALDLLCGVVPLGIRHDHEFVMAALAGSRAYE
jgi:hypothetical protein